MGERNHPGLPVDREVFALLKEHEERRGLREVARELDVSPNGLRKLLNNEGRAYTKTREKVRKWALRHTSLGADESCALAAKIVTQHGYDVLNGNLVRRT